MMSGDGMFSKDDIRHFEDFFRDKRHGGGPGLEVLVGMIASGKSTYARERSKSGAVVVCHDAIVRAMHPGGEYDSYSRPMYHAVEDAMIRAAVEAGKRVIIDRTNLEDRVRARWFRRREELGVPLVFVVFPIEDFRDHARRKFEHDPGGLSLDKWTEIAGDHWTTAAREKPPAVDESCKQFKVVAYRHGDPVTDPLA